MSDFDYSAYITNLDILLKSAQEDYKQITYDRRKLQHSILRNYLWLATAIVSAQIAYFINMTSENPLVPWSAQMSMRFYFFIIIALALSGIAFAYGIDTMRGRAGVCFPYEYAYSHMTDMAHKEAASQIASGSLAVYMIQTLEIAINHQREIARETGEKLRMRLVPVNPSIAATRLAPNAWGLTAWLLACGGGGGGGSCEGGGGAGLSAI